MKIRASITVLASILMLTACQSAQSIPAVEQPAPVGQTSVQQYRDAGLALTQSDRLDSAAQQRFAVIMPGVPAYPNETLFRHTEWACAALQAEPSKEDYVLELSSYFLSIQDPERPPLTHILALTVAGAQQYCPASVNAMLSDESAPASGQESTGDAFWDGLCANTKDVCPLTQEEYAYMVRVISQTCMWLKEGKNASEIIAEFRKLTTDEREVLRYAEAAGYGSGKMCPEYSGSLLGSR